MENTAKMAKMAQVVKATFATSSTMDFDAPELIIENDFVSFIVYP